MSIFILQTISRIYRFIYKIQHVANEYAFAGRADFEIAGTTQETVVEGDVVVLDWLSTVVEPVEFFTFLVGDFS